MNIFSLDEEQSGSNYSRKISLSCTDSAIDKFSSILSGYVPLTTPKNPKQVVQSQQQLTFPFVQTASGENHLDHSEINNEEVLEITAKNVSDDSPAYDYFDRDSEGYLISTSPDYKGKNKKLQQQRFSLLYVWAYNSINGETVPIKEHLSKAARLNGVYDQNYSQNLTDVANRYFIKADGTFKLNPSGKVHLNEIQKEMKDSELSGFVYSNSTRKKSSRSSRTTKADSQKVEQWVQMPSKFDNFDVRELKTLAEYAIFSIYPITKELKTENAVKPSLAYEYLTKRYTVPVQKKSFTDALSSKSNEKYFKRTSEGLYYLTQEADGIAESWINQVEVSS
jgi:hypothetical protein